MSSTHNNITNKSHGNPLLSDKPFNHVPTSDYRELTLQERIDSIQRQKEMAFREHEKLGTNLYEQHMAKLRQKYKVSSITLESSSKAREQTLEDVAIDNARNAQRGFKLATAKVNVGSKPTRLWIDVKI